MGSPPWKSVRVAGLQERGSGSRLVLPGRQGGPRCLARAERKAAPALVNEATARVPLLVLITFHSLRAP